MGCSTDISIWEALIGQWVGQRYEGREPGRVKVDLGGAKGVGGPYD